MSMRNRIGLIFGGLGIAGLIITTAVLVQRGDNFEYVFTNLTTEDSNEVSQTLKASGIPTESQPMAVRSVFQKNGFTTRACCWQAPVCHGRLRRF